MNDTTIIISRNDILKDHTALIQEALDSCKAMGGTVTIRQGDYYISSLEIFSNTTLCLEYGCNLLGVQDASCYRNSYERTEEVFMQKALFFAGEQQNIRICGDGIIDGRGDEQHFPPQGKTPSGESSERPKLFSFYKCNNVRMENLTLKNPAGWGLLFQKCDNLRFNNLTMRFLSNYNNDGFDLDSCHNVFISGCDIHTGDDAICPKCTDARGCKNIIVSDCIIRSNTSGFKLGTSSFGDFSFITVNNCIFHDCTMGTIKLTNVDGGKMHDIRLSNLLLDNCEGPIFIRAGERGLDYDNPKTDGESYTGRIFLSNISGTVTGGYDRCGILITGTSKRRISDVYFSDVYLSFPGGCSEKFDDLPEDEQKYPEQFFFGNLPASVLYIRHADNIHFAQTRFEIREIDSREEIILSDCSKINKEEVDLSYKGC
ncbi:MAG: right-handed parallel beta-helix repeat-containing protein [Clostridia bacterium]|nr:right-handed parallel beta-helix repeat-containing protein [Clostridia bacterium]